MNTRFASILLLSLCACGSDKETENEETIEEEEESFIQAADFVGHWTPSEYPLEREYDDGDFASYEAVHLILNDDLTGTFELQEKYISASGTTGDYFYMADVTASYEDPYLKIVVDSVTREDNETGETADNPVFAQEFSCYPEDNPVTNNFYIDCEPNGWASHLEGYIRFTK